MDETEAEIQGTLPKSFVLKSKFNRRYLRYIRDHKQIHGFLQFSADHIVNPLAKFEVEKAKSNKGLIHIRCPYNNKYWVRWSANSKYIVAAAKDKEEDTKKPTCTLFEPIFDHNQKAFRFRHAQLDSYLHLRFSTHPLFENCLFAGANDYGGFHNDDSDLSFAVDWETLFVLPKHIAFKGDNTHFLRVHQSGTPYLEFCGSDLGDPFVGNDIFTTPDGHVRIKNDHTGKFWIRDPNWIHVKASECDFDDPNTLFWPVKLDNNRVALRNRGNNHFCKRLSTDGKNNCLNSAVQTITKEAKMEIYELAITRTIYDVNFRVSEARTYGETPMTMSSGELINNNSVAEKIKKKLRYEDSKSSTWSSSTSTKLGMKVSIEAGVPEVSTQALEISAEIRTENTWGETTETKTRIEVEHVVEVPPFKRVKVSVLATKAFCDIPFSYTQRDVLSNGKVVVQHFDDGLYTGSNCYNYSFLAEQESL